MNKPHYKRHRDDDRGNIIDDISIRVVPRYKTSGLSGDEWRVCAVIELKRKGDVMFSRSYSDVETAAAHLPWVLKTWCEDAGDEWSDRIKKDHTTCHQPGCAEPATVIVKLKKEYSREGFERDLSDHYCEVRRAFCQRHSTRGDCGLEDADVNYEIVVGDVTDPRTGDESPSAFGGVVELSPKD